MAAPKRLKTVSAATQSLLLQGESSRADFKRAPEGISADDLVAFANSAPGGTILAGVDERTGIDGAQVGVVVGCNVSDAAILQIANKALSCLPPIALEVQIENLGTLPFLRIDVPSSATKPHCTPKGVYCRRDGSRNRALHPSELLQIFLESEARAFAQKFEAAAGRISDDLIDLQETLDSSIQSMANQLGWADSKLGDTEDTLSSILNYVHRLNAETNDVVTRLRTMFRQDKRKDPIREREWKKLRDEIVDQILNDKKLHEAIETKKSMSIKAEGKAAEELTKDDLGSIFHEAVQIVADRKEREKYSIDIKKPAECSGAELEDLANLIKEGGEVVDGIKARLKRADALGLIRYEKTLVGCGALKKPAVAYRKSVFVKAKATASSDDFSRELGWIFIKEKNRSKGQIRPLVETLLKVAGDRGVFATTRRSNEKMQRILEHQEFVRHSECYSSTQSPGEELMLFVRPGKKRKVDPVSKLGSPSATPDLPRIT